MQIEIENIVKALTYVAWADGRLDPREESMLVNLYLKLGLTQEETQSALAPSKQALDVKELARSIPTAAGRHKLLRLLLELSFADDVMTFEEYKVIEKVAKILEVSEEDLEILRVEILQGPAVETP